MRSVQTTDSSLSRCATKAPVAPVTTARKVTGAPIPAENVPVGSGEMPAVVLDISATKALGYRPAFDLESGMATVWPDFAPEGATA